MPPSTSTQRWVFGYGSLIWRPDFSYDDVADVWIGGYARRFWQASKDHRGTPEEPGRVVTLVEAPGERCWGRAYLVEADVLDHLDHRERGGYSRHELLAHRARGGQIKVLVYIGGPDNPQFIGRAPMGEMVSQIVESVGPSGANSEYLLSLDDALTAMGAQDEHVTALAAAVRKYLKKQHRKQERRRKKQTEP
jgi:cation transport regulator ChaC